MSNTFTYDQALHALHGALAFGIEPSLEGIRALLVELGSPHTRFASIQVAGTNGKTSTARMIAALIKSQGLRVGLYTSPELVRYPERIEVAGRVISDEEFATAVMTAVNAIPAAEEVSGRPITEFEILTAAALWEFARQEVDVAVLEVGLGGTWDSTSVVDPAVSVITGVGLDHTAILGDTLEEIATEKAGIIKPASTAILGPGTAPTPEIEKIFIDRVRECGTQVRFARDISAHPEYSRLTAPGPVYQSLNIGTAVAATEAALGRPLNVRAAQEALDGLAIPGRFEQVVDDPVVIIDGSHNPQAAQVLAGEVLRRFGDERPLLLLGMLADKDARGFVEAVAPVAGEIAVTQPAGDRALPVSDLARIVRETTGAMPQTYATVGEALESVLGKKVPVIVTGSIKTAGEAKGFLC